MTTRIETREVSASLKFGQFLTIEAPTKRGLVVTTYLVQIPGPGRVDLVTWDEEKREAGEVYSLTRYSCTCRDWKYRARKEMRPCKHRLACGLPHVALLPPATIEPETQDAPDHDA